MAQNQANFFLTELFSAQFVNIAQYRRYMYQHAWNVAVLMGKTQVFGKNLGQLRPGPPQFPRSIEWVSMFRGLEEKTLSSARIFHGGICKFIIKGC